MICIILPSKYKKNNARKLKNTFPHKYWYQKTKKKTDVKCINIIRILKMS